MADVQILAPGQESAPLDYLVPGAQEILVKNLSAKFDGSAASVTWQPAITLIAPGGKEVGTFPLTNGLAAGASADVSWFPGVKNASSTSPPVTGPIPWPAGNQAISTLDNTTYPNVPDGGTLETLVINGAVGSTLFATADLGDAAPRMLIVGPTGGGVLYQQLVNDGTVDPYFNDSAGWVVESTGTPGEAFLLLWSQGQFVLGFGFDGNFPRNCTVVEHGLKLKPQQGGGTGVIQTSGSGAPTIGGNVGDKYWRSDGGTGTLLYTCTVAGTGGLATWVAIL